MFLSLGGWQLRQLWLKMHGLDEPAPEARQCQTGVWAFAVAAGASLLAYRWLRGCMVWHGLSLVRSEGVHQSSSPEAGKASASYLLWALLSEDLVSERPLLGLHHGGFGGVGKAQAFHNGRVKRKERGWYCGIAGKTHFLQCWHPMWLLV